MAATMQPDTTLHGRADTAQEDQIKAQMSSISPPLASAKAQLKQAKEAIPQTNKDQIKAAEENVKNTFNGLPQDQKDKLKAAKQQFKSAKESAKASATPAPAA